MGDTYYIPKIEVSKKQINICQDTDKRELLFARNKTSNGESQNANPENNQNKKSPNTSDSLLETFFLSLLLFTLFGTLLLKTNSKKGNLE